MGFTKRKKVKSWMKTWFNEMENCTARNWSQEHHIPKIKFQNCEKKKQIRSISNVKLQSWNTASLNSPAVPANYSFPKAKKLITTARRSWFRFLGWGLSLFSVSACFLPPSKDLQVSWTGDLILVIAEYQNLSGDWNSSVLQVFPVYFLGHRDATLNIYHSKDTVTDAALDIYLWS